MLSLLVSSGPDKVGVKIELTVFVILLDYLLCHLLAAT